MTLTDEEIRVKVAELMGWVRKEEIGWWGGYRWYHNGSPVECEAPSFYTDPAAALQLCDRMHSEGRKGLTLMRTDNGWSCVLPGIQGKYPTVTSSDPSLTRAVTLCFLAAHSNGNTHH